MTARNLHREFLQQCKTIYSDGEASAITSIIFECITGLYKSDIIMYPERILPEQQQARLKECLAEVLNEKPVQYVTGEAWFSGMKLYVNSDVLIPRPETEQLAELVIDHLKDDPYKSVLDIGTGSGCIPIAIKNAVPQSTVTAIDVCNSALSIARKNAQDYRADINFIQSDFLDMNQWDSFPVYDVIVSNPPYIPVEEKKTLPKNISYEPSLALFVDGESPLLFYHRIALFGKDHLKKGGQAFMEVHEQYARQVAAYFKNNGYAATILKDMFGKQRIVTAIHCP